MKKLMEHIDSLILNWGVEDGKLSSLEELYGVLIDKGWDHPSATAYLNNIHKVFLGEAPEDDTKPLTDKDKEILKQKGLAYIRGTKPPEYGKKNNKGEGEKPAVFVNVDGKLQKPDEAEKDTDSKSKDKEEDETQKATPDDFDVDKHLDNPPEKKKNISKENQKKVNFLKKKVEEARDLLDKDKQDLVDECMDKIETLYDDDATEDEKKEAAEWLMKNGRFSTNAMPKSGLRKAYLNGIGGMRKILSASGTKASEDLVQQMEKYVDLGEPFNPRALKDGFSAAAKPDLGDENIAKPEDDESVKEFHERHPIMKKIRSGLHGLYVVKDKDGRAKMPSSQYSKDYLEQSINNPALQNTIDFAKEQAEAGNVDEGVPKALEAHQKRLQKILEEVPVPSEEARKAIADSYNQLMVDLHKADSDIANSILKQIAENNLYEQELANGEEVYLPSAGNFPAGDKIKVNGGEVVALISCKWGKQGRTYGCPANSKTICELHQDKSKQNNQGQYLGEEGHTLLINDDLIKGENKKETKEKTKNWIKKTLQEVDLGDTFTEEEIEKIAEITADYMEEIERIQELTKDLKPANVKWETFQREMKKIDDKFRKLMGGVITKEHAAALIGENNAGNLIERGGKVKPEALLSAIEIANNIRTNETLTELEHNKQFYDENNEPKFVTSKGTNDPNDYSITFRTRRTKGRSGGGCQLSFTGDGKPADVELKDGGEVLDSETGEIKEV